MSDTIWLANHNVAGAPGYNWDVAGDEGAIEVPSHVAHHLIDIQDSGFYIVSKKSSKKHEPTEAEKAEAEANAKAAEALEAEKKAAEKKSKPSSKEPAKPDLKEALSNV